MKNINELIFRVNNNLRNNLNVEKDDIKELLTIAMKMEKQFAISGVVKSSYCECDAPIIRTSVNMEGYCGNCGEDIKQ